MSQNKLIICFQEFLQTPPKRVKALMDPRESFSAQSVIFIILNLFFMFLTFVQAW